jgi:trans-aconitate methyltransferase
MVQDRAMPDVWRLYETHARRFDADRSRTLMERGYLDEIVRRLPPGASVLDLGCGAGEPIARSFIEQGLSVTGVDAAPTMIAICRERFPRASWIEADMRTLDLGRRFDAVVAWDSFFHLTQDEQRAMFEVVTHHAAPGALLLFTSGPAAGVSIGDLYGHALFHASLDESEYRRLLHGAGFEVLCYSPEDPGCGGHTIWLARSIRQV